MDLELCPGLVNPKNISQKHRTPGIDFLLGPNPVLAAYKLEKQQDLDLQGFQPVQIEIEFVESTGLQPNYQR